MNEGFNVVEDRNSELEIYITRESRNFELSEKEVIKSILLFIEEQGGFGGYAKDCKLTFDDASKTYNLEIQDGIKTKEAEEI